MEAPSDIDEGQLGAEVCRSRILVAFKALGEGTRAAPGQEALGAELTTLVRRGVETLEALAAPPAWRVLQVDEGLDERAEAISKRFEAMERDLDSLLGEIRVVKEGVLRCQEEKTRKNAERKESARNVLGNEYEVVFNLYEKSLNILSKLSVSNLEVVQRAASDVRREVSRVKMGINFRRISSRSVQSLAWMVVSLVILTIGMDSFLDDLRGFLEHYLKILIEKDSVTVLIFGWVLGTVLLERFVFDPLLDGLRLLQLRRLVKHQHLAEFKMRAAEALLAAAHDIIESISKDKEPASSLKAASLWKAPTFEDLAELGDLTPLLL